MYFLTRETLEEKKPDDRGIKLVDALEFHEFYLLNSRSCSDHPANFTRVSSKGIRVIDLVWCSYSGLSVCNDLYVCNYVIDSDHLPVALKLAITTPNLLNESIKVIIWNDLKKMSFKKLCNGKVR